MIVSSFEEKVSNRFVFNLIGFAIILKSWDDSLVEHYFKNIRVFVATCMRG